MDRDSRRLPAFGRDLLLARRSGRTPDVVHVLLGDDWTRPSADPCLGLRCEDWRPRRIDWTPCIGVPVLVHERGPHPRNTAPHATALVERVAAELVWVAGAVRMQFVDGQRWDIEEWARAVRLDRRDRAWPEWWSDAHAQRAAQSRGAFLHWLVGLPAERFIPAARALL